MQLEPAYQYHNLLITFYKKITYLRFLLPLGVAIIITLIILLLLWCFHSPSKSDMDYRIQWSMNPCENHAQSCLTSQKSECCHLVPLTPTKDSSNTAPCVLWIQCYCRNYVCGVRKPWKHSSAYERRIWKLFPWTCGMVSSGLLPFTWWPMKFEKPEHMTFFFVSCDL